MRLDLPILLIGSTPKEVCDVFIIFMRDLNYRVAKLLFAKMRSCVGNVNVAQRKRQITRGSQFHVMRSRLC